MAGRMPPSPYKLTEEQRHALEALDMYWIKVREPTPQAAALRLATSVPGITDKHDPCQRCQGRTLSVCTERLTVPVVVNYKRWTLGSPRFDGPLRDYRPSSSTTRWGTAWDADTRVARSRTSGASVDDPRAAAEEADRRSASSCVMPPGGLRAVLVVTDRRQILGRSCAWCG